MKRWKKWAKPGLATVHKFGTARAVVRRRPKNTVEVQTAPEVHASRASLVFSPKPNIWRVVYKGELLQEAWETREDARAILRGKMRILR